MTESPRVPSLRPPTTLLIDAGDLPALAAVSMQHDPAAVVLWSPLSPDRVASRQMAERHRELLGCSLAAELPWAQDPDDAPTMLAQAIQIARSFGARRIIWPARFGPDAPETEAAMRTAAALTGLSALWERTRGRGRAAARGSGGGDGTETGAGQPALRATRGTSGKTAQPASGAFAAAGRVEIDCPFVDLDHDQVVDLADDAGAPLELFWPCREPDGPAPCGHCEGCRFWAAAFHARELPLPFGRPALRAGGGTT